MSVLSGELGSATGAPLSVPALRDTLERRFAAKGAAPVDAVKVMPAHERILGMG